MKREPTLTCRCCDKTIYIGDMIRYSPSSYTPYCYDTDCADGVKTLSTGLEECWWDEEFWKEWEKENKSVLQKGCYS